MKKILGENVLVEVIKKKAKTKSGIALPVRAKSNQGIVKGVGPEAERRTRLKIGDRVIFKKYKEINEIKVKSKPHYFLEVDDILAKY